MLCGVICSVVTFMTVSFWMFHQVNLWTEGTCPRCRACLGVVVYTLQSVHRGIYLGVIG